MTKLVDTYCWQAFFETCVLFIRSSIMEVRRIKHTLLFIISFSLFYLVLQWLSGLIITMIYVPSFNGEEQASVSFGIFSLPFVYAFIAAIAAFWLTQQMKIKTNTAY